MASNKNNYAFIDESGTLPDPQSPIIVVSAIVTQSPERLKKIIQEVRKKGNFRSRSGEIKFYTSGIKTKTSFFEKLTRENIGIFVLVTNKQGRKIVDSPQNFAVLCWLLIESIINFYPDLKVLVFDRHFYKQSDQNLFSESIYKLVQRGNLQIYHVNSQEDIRVNAADMIAGAVLASETGKGDDYYRVFKGKIISETRINWSEAKNRLITQSKNLARTGASTHP